MSIYLSQQGRVLGITVGCILGMIPLLFFKNKDTKEEEDKKKDESNKLETSSDSKKQEKQENTK